MVADKTARLLHSGRSLSLCLSLSLSLSIDARPPTYPPCPEPAMPAGRKPRDQYVHLSVMPRCPNPHQSAMPRQQSPPAAFPDTKMPTRPPCPETDARRPWAPRPLPACPPCPETSVTGRRARLSAMPRNQCPPAVCPETSAHRPHAPTEMLTGRGLRVT